jgi:hypothetical protein
MAMIVTHNSSSSSSSNNSNSNGCTVDETTSLVVSPWHGGLLHNELTPTTKLRTDLALHASRTRDQQRRSKTSVLSFFTDYNIDDGDGEDSLLNGERDVWRSTPGSNSTIQQLQSHSDRSSTSKPNVDLAYTPTPGLNWSTNYRVALMFLCQNERTSKYFWNRMAQWWSGASAIHAELLFEHDNTSCVVTANTPVSFRKNKIYHYDAQNPRIWQSVQLTLDAVTYDRVYQFCRQQENQPFDALGIHCFPLLHYQSVLCAPMCTPPNQSRGWICSRLVAAAFKHANIFSSNVNEYAITPGELLTLLTEDMPATFRARYKLAYSTCIGRDPLRKLYDV